MNAAVMSCSELFDDNQLAKIESFTASKEVKFQEMKNSGEVLLDIFSQILNAPNNSTVKFFTKNINNDGIGALLLLVSVHESNKERGLKFEFYLEEGSGAFRIHNLFAENSTNKVRFKPSTESRFSKTVVVIESPNGTSTIGFDGDLTSLSLKDSGLKKAIPVRYAGVSVMRASPFRTIGVDNQVDIRKLNEASYNLDLTSKIDMNESDVSTINRKAADLSVQLYMLKYNHVPKVIMSSLQILSELSK